MRYHTLRLYMSIPSAKKPFKHEKRIWEKKDKLSTKHDCFCYLNKLIHVPNTNSTKDTDLANSQLYWPYNDTKCIHLQARMTIPDNDDKWQLELSVKHATLNYVKIVNYQLFMCFYFTFEWLLLTYDCFEPLLLTHKEGSLVGLEPDPDNEVMAAVGEALLHVEEGELK